MGVDPKAGIIHFLLDSATARNPTHHSLAYLSFEEKTLRDLKQCHMAHALKPTDIPAFPSLPMISK